MTAAIPEPIEVDLNKLVGEYQTFIVEIFRRLDAVSESMAELLSDPLHANAWQNADFCWLQIRKICEYLALGIVLAHHRDGDGVEDLTKWRPRDLLAEANKLSDHPTPTPIALEKNENGNQIMPLSKPVQGKALSAIYGKCSELLHVGSLDRILKDQMPAYDIGQLQNWVQGFNALLRNHVLLLPKVKRAILCVHENGNLSVTLLGGNGEATFNMNDLPDCGLLA